MATKSKKQSGVSQTFLLDKARMRHASFSSLQPEWISSVVDLRKSFAHASKDSLWISYARDLTEALLRNNPWTFAPMGRALLVHSIDMQSLPALGSCFRRVAFSTDGGFLPTNELAAALNAENKSDLFIGGSVDAARQTITLWRGNLEPLTVPFSAFEKSGDGTEPDFGRFAVSDFGHTIRLGQFEAASDAVLYEFDTEYRRRISKERLASERSFGASLRRLRKQRGLRREDFAPDIAAKTIARIEQGKVNRVHANTLNVIAKRLAVIPEEIETF